DPGWLNTPLTGTAVSNPSQSATFSAPAPVRPWSQRLGSGIAAQARQADKRAARRYDRLLRPSGKGRAGASAERLWVRCSVGAWPVWGRAPLVPPKSARGGKGLGRRIPKGGTGGVWWHRGCAPLHTIFSMLPDLPSGRVTPSPRLPGQTPRASGKNGDR